MADKFEQDNFPSLDDFENAYKTTVDNIESVATVDDISLKNCI